MSDQKISLNLYAKRRYNVSGEVSFEVGMNYMGALLMLAGADGDLSKPELDWLIEEQILLGAPPELIDKIRNYDWKNADLDALLKSIQYDFPMNAKRTMIYQAIKMAKADLEYHEKEKAAIREAAQKLQIDLDVLIAIEQLVEMENAVDKLRFALIGTSQT